MTQTDAELAAESRVAEMAALLEEELQSPPPLNGPEDVPGDVNAVTSEWLTAVLCGSVPGAAVTSFDVDNSAGARYEGVGAGRRVTVTYNDAGRAAGLPENLWAKYSPTLMSRQFVGVNGASAGEVAFYNTVATRVDAEIPKCYYAGFEPRSCRTMFLFENIVVEKNARYASPVDLYVDKQLAESMIDLCAAFHSTFWGVHRLPEYPYRDVLRFQKDFNDSFGFEAVSLQGFEYAKDFVAPEIAARKQEWHDAFMRSLEINIRATPTIVHQDMHLANWYVLPDKTMGVFDLQCLARGQWAIDLAYVIALSLTTEDRRAWERDLLTRYLDKLRGYGVDAPDFDQAWLAYRQQMFHALAFWVSTTGWGEDRTQPEDVCNAFIQRSSQAMVDLDSWAALDE